MGLIVANVNQLGSLSSIAEQGGNLSGSSTTQRFKLTFFKGLYHAFFANACTKVWTLGPRESAEPRDRE